MKHYGYFRSSAAYRVRIALALKELPHDFISVHLKKDGGQHQKPDYLNLNPQGLVPTLITDDGAALTQSLAIIEYLDEVHPTPAFLPSDPLGRAKVRAIAQAIACDIHPVNNLRILDYITGPLGGSKEDMLIWYKHWINEGFRGLEGLLQASSHGKFCYGDTPGMADICLVPQVFNAQRFNCDLSAFPRSVEIASRCNEMPAFANAAPGKQPDAE